MMKSRSEHDEETVTELTSDALKMFSWILAETSPPTLEQTEPNAVQSLRGKAPLVLQDGCVDRGGSPRRLRVKGTGKALGAAIWRALRCFLMSLR
ncbi:unnamed protein product [Gadus morhua 'NCC']